jgi:dolichyl-phosphate beta-glucosyltransferase
VSSTALTARRVRTLIVVPCYNEESRLDVAAFAAHLREAGDVGFVFVDDGSRDRTRAVLDRLAQDTDRVAVLSLERNSGKAEAVRRGVLESLRYEPQMVGYWDADLATPLAAIDELRAVLAAEPDAELAMGARVKLLGRTILRRPVRHFIGRVFATCASIVLRLPVYDTQCGAKLMRVTDRTQQLFAEPFATRWIFDVELIARTLAARRIIGAPDHGIREVPLRRWTDVQGSKVGITDGVVAFIELARIRKRYPAGRAASSDPAHPVDRRRSREHVGDHA